MISWVCFSHWTRRSWWFQNRRWFPQLTCSLSSSLHRLPKSINPWLSFIPWSSTFSPGKIEQLTSNLLLFSSFSFHSLVPVNVSEKGGFLVGHILLHSVSISREACSEGKKTSTYYHPLLFFYSPTRSFNPSSIAFSFSDVLKHD